MKIDTAKVLTITDTGDNIPECFSTGKSQIGEGESQGFLIQNTKGQKIILIILYVLLYVLTIVHRFTHFRLRR